MGRVLVGSQVLTEAVGTWVLTGVWDTCGESDPDEGSRGEPGPDRETQSYGMIRLVRIA